MFTHKHTRVSECASINSQNCHGKIEHRNGDGIVFCLAFHFSGRWKYRTDLYRSPDGTADCYGPVLHREQEERPVVSRALSPLRRFQGRMLIREPSFNKAADRHAAAPTRKKSSTLWASHQGWCPDYVTEWVDFTCDICDRKNGWNFRTRVSQDGWVQQCGADLIYPVKGDWRYASPSHWVGRCNYMPWLWKRDLPKGTGRRVKGVCDSPASNYPPGGQGQ